jgi:hypothetical protein
MIIANGIGNHNVECPRGAFSLCVEVVVRKDHIDTLCRVWSDGFTITDGSSTHTGAAAVIMKAPPQDEHIIRFPRLPVLLRTVSNRKRMLASTMDTEQTDSPLKKSLTDAPYVKTSGNNVLLTF